MHLVNAALFEYILLIPFVVPVIMHFTVLVPAYCAAEHMIAYPASRAWEGLMVVGAIQTLPCLDVFILGAEVESEAVATPVLPSDAPRPPPMGIYIDQRQPANHDGERAAAHAALVLCYVGFPGPPDFHSAILLSAVSTYIGFISYPT